ncbi:tellurite resistance/C4-dicarboxylate transporter family protein [Gordonia sp. (in: high G+C Gram-positive bacteria)]|uniref:tellurite resistance/C4-dicarboxylate transporter family protein n=1 Tax=Gordonia sp. (in: high G+C Gram-positive bacteria) TaxID=84139 RepID=UPI0026167B0D|nr:tellurite resistance/C4-dicarboxylate transporter family protein [Gordonia sp. (in: high G+C Gram-positive bacteria)]
MRGPSMPAVPDAPGRSTLAGRVDDAVRTLTPGYFALVMATGIISLGLHSTGATMGSAVLLWIAVAAYAVLVVMNVVRGLRYPQALRADFADPARSFGLFTFVAATCVLGSRLTADGLRVIPLALLLTGAMAWIVLGYTVPWMAVRGQAEGIPALGIANGTWFIWAVASQSVAVLAAMLEPTVVTGRTSLALLAVFSWSVGVFLYCAVGVLLMVRLLAHPFAPDDMTPPYWVAMGATAITVVAGARIVMMADAPMVDATRGLIAGAAVFFWAFGTWLIPPLIAAGYWKHVRRRVPLRYEATLWSIIFPLGMYGVGSRFLGEIDHLPMVHAIGVGESWFALAAWLATFVAMVVHGWRTVVRPG